MGSQRVRHSWAAEHIRTPQRWQEALPPPVWLTPTLPSDFTQGSLAQGNPSAFLTGLHTLILHWALLLHLQLCWPYLMVCLPITSQAPWGQGLPVSLLNIPSSAPHSEPSTNIVVMNESAGGGLTSPAHRVQALGEEAPLRAMFCWEPPGSGQGTVTGWIRQWSENPLSDSGSCHLEQDLPSSTYWSEWVGGWYPISQK